MLDGKAEPKNMDDQSLNYLTRQLSSEETPLAWSACHQIIEIVRRESSWSITQSQRTQLLRHLLLLIKNGKRNQGVATWALVKLFSKKALPLVKQVLTKWQQLDDENLTAVILAIKEKCLLRQDQTIWSEMIKITESENHPTAKGLVLKIYVRMLSPKPKNI